MPILRAAVIIRALLKAGFVIIRQTGSHVQLRHLFDATRHATVPMHSKDISRAILASILRQAKLSLKEFLRYLK